MSRRGWTCSLAAALAVSGSAPASGQTTCTDTMTVQECADALVAAGQVGVATAAPEPNDERRGETLAGAQAESETAGKPAGESDAQDASIDDFIPRLAAAALTPGLDSGMVGRLTLNIPLNSEHFNYLPLAFRVAGEVRRPAVYAPMLDSIPEALRPGVRERLETDLGEFDDVELTAAINRENLRYGRRWEPHVRELALVRQEYRPMYAHHVAELALARFIGEVDLLETSACSGLHSPNAPLSCLSQENRDSLASLARAVTKRETDFAANYADWEDLSGWKHVPDLLNNQPQVSFSFAWRPREHAVGPEYWTAAGRYERGYVNLNSVRAYCTTMLRRGARHDGDKEGYANGQFEPRCFRDYLTSNANKGLLRMGIRWFVEGKLTRERHFDAPFLETDSATFSVPAAWRGTIEGGVGGFLPTRADVQGSRVDLAFAGEWALTENSIRPDKRLTVSLSLTQRLNQNFSLLTGLVWSDRGEFEGDDVTPVRLRLGVRYKLVPQQPTTTR